MIDHIVAVHTRTIVLDRDCFGSLVEGYDYVLGVGIPRIGNDLRQHGRQVAIQVHSQMLESIQADPHQQWPRFFHMRALSSLVKTGSILIAVGNSAKATSGAAAEPGAVGPVKIDAHLSVRIQYRS